MVGNSNERLSHGQSSFSSFEQYCRSLRKSINRPDSGKQHDWWDKGQGWKNILNNLRLVIQPFVFFNKTLANRISNFIFINFNTNCLDESPRGAIPNTQESEKFLFSPPRVMEEHGKP